MDSVTIRLHDVAYSVQAPPEVVMWMVNDHQYALQVLRENINVENETAGCRKREAGRQSFTESPSLVRVEAKKTCHLSTPEAWKFEKSSSSPKACRKSLLFCQDEGASATLAIRKLPVPFMKTNFVTCLEKLVRRKEICNESRASVVNSEYDERNRCMTIEFRTSKIANALLNLKTVKFLNNSITFEEVRDPLCNSEDDEHDSSEECSADSNVTEEISLSSTADDHDNAFDYDLVMPNDHEDLEERSVLAASNDEIIVIDDDDEVPAESGVFSDGVFGTGDDSFISNDGSNNSRKAEVHSNVLTSEIRSSSKVEVYNLPPLFSDDVLLYELNESISTNDSFICHSISRKRNDVVEVECSSIEAPVAVCSLEGSFEFYGKKLTFVHVPGPQLLQSSDKIHVANLPSGFNNDILMHIVSKGLWKKGVVPAGTSAAITVMDAGTDCATVQLISVEAAAEAAEMTDVKYAGCLLKISVDVAVPSIHDYGEDAASELDQFKIESHVLRSNSSPEVLQQKFDANFDFENLHDERDAMLNDSVYVKYSNLPPNIDTAAFTSFLTLKMSSAGFLDNGNSVIEKCTTLTETSALVEFSTSQEANLANLLDNLKYRGNVLEWCKIVPEDPSHGSIEGPLLSPKTISFESPEGVLIFRRLLVKYRHLFPATGPLDAAVETVRQKLQRKGVCTTGSQIRQKRKNLLDQYTKAVKENKTTGKNYLLNTVLFGKADINVLKGTAYYDDSDAVNEDDENENDEHTSDLVRFCKAASWTVPATKALINMCIENKGEFEKSQRIVKFWRNVSIAMAEKKHYYTEDQCRNKINSLTSTYTTYRKNANSTGAEGPSKINVPMCQEVLTLMEELTQGFVKLDPKVTIAEGLKSVTVASKDAPAEGVRRGKARPCLLKKNETLAVRKVSAKETQANAFKLMAEEYALKQQFLRGEMLKKS